MTVEKPKPKQLLRPITTGADSTTNQSQFLEITCNTLKAREKSRVHGAIALVLLLIGWKTGASLLNQLLSVAIAITWLLSTVIWKLLYSSLVFNSLTFWKVLASSHHNWLRLPEPLRSQDTHHSRFPVTNPEQLIKIILFNLLKWIIQKCTSYELYNFERQNGNGFWLIMAANLTTSSSVTK